MFLFSIKETPFFVPRRNHSTWKEGTGGDRDQDSLREIVRETKRDTEREVDDSLTSCKSEIEIQRKQKQQGFYHIRTVVIHYVILLR